ncbi:MAG: M3 family metallopeptidase [Candidatus Eisenbacteria bacterium]|jgi:oligoendopeptidase F|nr:M3 family metallopeptidase [Candidatus Eisenbacteria bacterium]
MMMLGALLLATQVLASSPFVAIPKEAESGYHLNLVGNFYPTEEEFQRDIGRLEAMVDSAIALKGQVTASIGNLLAVHGLLERLDPLWSKAYIYAHLRHSVNTEDRACMDRIRNVSGDLSSELSFVGLEVAHLSPDTLSAWLQRDPRIARFEWPIRREMRRKNHLLSLPEEELLATLSPAMDPWPRDLYQACLDRTEFPTVGASSGDTLSVLYSYGQLRIDPDRAVRRAAYYGYMDAMQRHADLYALALRNRVTVKNRLAEVRHFSDFTEEALFDGFLESASMDSVFQWVTDRAELGKAFQELRRRRIQGFAQLDTVFLWDMSLLPPGVEHPRWTITEASQVLLDALGMFGEEYRSELASLLDPANGRLDLVSGPNREPGAFAWGYHGAPWQFFSFSYEGFYGDLATLAHEGGHAVHYKLIYNHGVPPLVSDGPSYLTESAAIFNEILVTDHLYRMATTNDLKAYFLQKLVGSAMSVFDIVGSSVLERDIYRAAAAGVTIDEALLDSLNLANNRVFSVFTSLHPESAKDWQLVSHYYDSPMYYVNYVVAQLLAMYYFERHQTDPSFVQSYLSLLSSAFDRPGPELFAERMGVDIMSKSLVQMALQVAERWMADLEALWKEQGI